MVRIGIVGIGFMGMIHYLASLQGWGAGQCDGDLQPGPQEAGGRLDRASRGISAPKVAQVDLSGLAKYADVGDLLADPDRSTSSTFASRMTSMPSWRSGRSRRASTSWSRSRSP